MKCKDCYKEGCSQRAYTADAECVFQQWAAKEFDWQSFRTEAAKDFVAALISVIDYEHTSDENIVKNAINLADELIKQLKEKEIKL